MLRRKLLIDLGSHADCDWNVEESKTYSRSWPTTDGRDVVCAHRITAAAGGMRCCGLLPLYGTIHLLPGLYDFVAGCVDSDKLRLLATFAKPRSRTARCRIEDLATNHGERRIVRTIDVNSVVTPLSFRRADHARREPFRSFPFARASESTPCHLRILRSAECASHHTAQP